MRRKLVHLLAAGLGMTASAFAAPREGWVWHMNGLKSEDDFARATNLLARAADSGYNAMALATGDGAYWKPELASRTKRLAETAKRLGVELIPHLWGVGYTGDLPWYLPEAVETTPVRGLRYRVSGGGAVFVPDRVMTGLEGQVVTNGFALKLRTELKPCRTYRLTCRVRTENVRPMNYHAVRGIIWHDGRAAHELYDFPVKETQDWKSYRWEFNTYGSGNVDLSVRRDAKMTGVAVFDSIAIEERPLTRCLTTEAWAKPKVRSAATGRIYAEGKDYAPLPKMKNPRPVEEALKIGILPDGAIRDGEELLVDAHVPAVQGASQYFLCPLAGGIREYWLKVAKDVDALIHPRRWFFGTDEVRIANRCVRCRAKGVSPGRLIGEFTAMMADVVREVNPKAEVCCWADMLCPLENAGRNPYYCVDGDLSDAWKYVPKDLIMVPWMNGRDEVKTTNCLMDHGFRCIAGGYYNYPDLSRDIHWRDGCKGNPLFLGMMFTTWGGVWGDGGYYKLEEYGRMINAEK